MKTKAISNALKLILGLALTTLVGLPTNAQEFKPSGKIYGHVFGDVYYKAASDTTAGAFKKYGSGNGAFSNVKKQSTAFTFRRIYLGYQYNVAPNFTTKVLLESSDL